MKIPITWRQHSVEVSTLKPYERNPRQISKEAYHRLLDNLLTFGYHQRIIVQPDLTVIGGHQRIRALQELGTKEIDVLVPNRELTHDEFRRLLIQDNLDYGGFDLDILATDFDLDELINLGIPRGLIEPGDLRRAKEKKERVSDPIHCPHCGELIE